MRVGLDLDGTIVIYDAIFHRLASEELGMPDTVPEAKEAVRDWVRTRPDGERRWIELQGLAYGPSMAEAPVAEGLSDFVTACERNGVELAVISHRTRRSVADPAVDLHAAAAAWLERKGLRFAHVFLEPTRAAKLARIRDEHCAMFVDDLEEVLAEPAFPPQTERWLYTPRDPGRKIPGVRAFADWNDLLLRALELRETTRAR